MKNFITTLVLVVFTASLSAQNFIAETKYDLGEMPRYSVPKLTNNSHQLPPWGYNQIIGSWGFWKQYPHDWLSVALADGWFYAGGDSEGQTFQEQNIYCVTLSGCNGGELTFASSWSLLLQRNF
jgi:hypothetical protein